MIIKQVGWNWPEFPKFKGLKIFQILGPFMFWLANDMQQCSSDNLRAKVQNPTVQAHPKSKHSEVSSLSWKLQTFPDVSTYIGKGVLGRTKADIACFIVYSYLKNKK